MSEALQTGLLLLMVGMITVFSVLGIVVLTGRVIIFMLNRSGVKFESQFARDPAPSKREATLKPSVARSKKIAAVLAATQVVTGGKGRIVSIQREES